MGQLHDLFQEIHVGRIQAIASSVCQAHISKYVP